MRAVRENPGLARGRRREGRLLSRPPHGPPRPSPRVREILQGFLLGRSLNELAPPGDPGRAEVEAWLAAVLGGASSPARPSARSGRPKGGIAYADGASRGNPGPAAIGFRLLDADGEELLAEGRRIGKATNNVAEYRAAIAAVERARELGFADLELRLDSELVVKQIRGEYRVKQPVLAGLKAELDRLLAGFRSWRVRHVRREQNEETDRIANEALEGR